jgi:hypothetical protein
MAHPWRPAGGNLKRRLGDAAVESPWWYELGYR